MLWALQLPLQTLAPPREQDDRGRRIRGADRRCHHSAINGWHTQITDHDIEHLPAFVRGEVFIDSFLPAIGRDDGVTVEPQNLPERPEYEWIVIHQQNPQWPEF